MKKIVRYSKDKVIIDVTLDKKIRKYLQLQNELKPILQQIKKETVSIMEKTGHNTMYTDSGTTFKFKKGYVKSSFDLGRLKEEDFDTYTAYLGVTDVNPSVNISLGGK